MAHHKSSKKRIRQTETRRLRNRLQAKTARNAIRDLKNETEANAAAKAMPSVIQKIDKLAKRGIIHKNKAANLKSRLMKRINKMLATKTSEVTVLTKKKTTKKAPVKKADTKRSTKK